MNSKRALVIFSGAGLSAESGIPTFRDSNGLWENHRVEDVASPEGWRRDPSLVLSFYGQRMLAVQNAEPNEAHRSIARLEEKFNVINFTQNIDNLLERAGCTNVRHMHGSLFKRKCERHVNTGDCASDCEFVEDHMKPIELGDLCPKCNSQLRPDVVWFGEAVQYEYEDLLAACKQIGDTDGIFVVIGTSGQVQPAGRLIHFFSHVKNKFIVDLDPVQIADYELIRGPATEGMRSLADQLLSS